MSMTKIPVSIGGFEILGTLGQGGMGVVYCVRDHTLGRDLAVKVQTGDWKQHPERLVRFLREARILANINHPNVVQIYSVGEHEGAPFFAMELLEGSIADAARLKAPGIAQVKRWMMEAARGLAAIHEKGVVHRDIKPGNLLLTRPTSLEEEHVKVADLGIATAGHQFGESLTRVGAVLGTSGYLPPEAFRAGYTLDGRADQYSLGVVFFELLARRSPYADMSDGAVLTAVHEPRSAPDVREFRPEVDAVTAQIVARMLSDDPEQRFDSTQSLVQALGFVQGDTARTAMASAVAPPFPQPVQRVGQSVHVAVAPATAVSRSPVIAASRFGILKAVMAGITLVTIIAAGYWFSKLPSPATSGEPAASAKPSPVVTEAAPASSAVVPATVDPKLGVAWAKYVLGEYKLSSRAGDEDNWSLNLQKQNNGVIRAELSGPEAEPIALTGAVVSQTAETIDGQESDIYALSLKDESGHVVDVRIEFTDEETAGEGSIVYQGQRRRFDIVDDEEEDESADE
jgi:eukaryotic-like serine/threonine-protein kinase